MIGAGGGFVLMPVLLLLYPHERPEMLTSVSLAVVFFNALSGSCAYAKMKRIDYRSGILFATATIPGAALGALATAQIPRRLFDAVFGLFMIAASLFLAVRPQRTHGGTREKTGFSLTDKVVEADGTQYVITYNPVLGVGLSVFVGFLSSLLGIGGGIIHVPALVYLLNFPVHIATATSHFILAVMAFTGTAVHAATGTLSHGIHRMILLAAGVLAGAQLGAVVSTRVRGAWIIRGLAIALGLAGIRILMISLLQ
jgi:uncharacterized membrane protein YfcA